MSEKLSPKGGEKLPSADSKEAREQLDKLGEKLASDAEKAKNKHDHEKEKHEARKSVEKHAISGKEKAPKHGERKSQREPITRGLKKQTYRATMKRVEARLPAYQRTFSRFINNEAVDKVSAVTGRTVARPSALLGSGLAAFIGLAFTTYYANRLGFEVPPAMFVVLIAGGWAGGLIAEAVYKSFRKLIKR